MNNIRILPMNLEKDLPIISGWDEEFKNDPKYDGIKHFVLEDNIYFGLQDLISIVYEKTPIGTRELCFAHTFKDDEDNILGFMLSNVIELDQNEPELIIFYIAIHPYAQGKGIGKTVLKKIIDNPEKYFYTRITNIFTKIDKDNIASRKLFSSMGFNLQSTPSNFLSANRKINQNEKE